MTAISEELSEAYDKVKEWPEKRMPGVDITTLGEGFADLLRLRNLIPATLAELQSLRSGNGGEVRVKALAWHGPDVNGDRHAASVFGTYTIRKQQGSMGFWLTQVGGYHRTIAEAEAAAFADYSRRILSALDIKP